MRSSRAGYSLSVKSGIIAREKGLGQVRPGTLLIFYLLLARRIKRHTEPFSKTRKGAARRRARRFHESLQEVES